MVTIVIDGRKVKAKEASTVLETARELNIAIPTLCYHKDLSPFGACRLCAVEVKTNGTWHLAASCVTPVVEGMEIKTDSDTVRESRQIAAKLLFHRYPETEAVRQVARELGVTVPERKGEKHECILCGLCARTCNEIVGVKALNFEDRGVGRDVETPRIKFDPNACIGCGSCAFVCPTGYVSMEQKGDKRIIWDKVFKMVPCSVCGRYFAPEDQLRYISEKTGVPMSELTVCTSCR
ncbi:MAG: 2Fe-2S iron-sulfur cluster-binding protein [Syntrophales bacterium]|jgi:NADH dehydrogenase/NADH:ubiquinone oxidoreductase subunit G|nr:2Fe-2S iron-sulfur cluster-binding protein [Syntrophales bacterium]MDY0044433.1 2Fe-2S iron-sulfur cluster-binding protein [Syntrophales bacterium]